MLPLRQRLLRFLVGLTLFSLLCPVASAQAQVAVTDRITETVTIPAGEWRAYVATLGSSDTFRISLQVSTGGAVDLYAMNAVGYEEYKNPTSGTFHYYPAATAENTTSSSKSLSAPAAGTYCFVVDNALISTSGAPGSSPVTVQVTAEVQTFPVWVVGLLLGILVTAVVVLIFVIRSRRRRRAALPPSPPEGPSPPAQPPQPPSPPPQPPGVP